MRSKFLRFTKAAEEYFGGDVDALTELALLQGMMMYARIIPTQVRLCDFGDTEKPAPESRATLEKTHLAGWHPISSGAAQQALTRGDTLLGMVWFRDHSKCEPNSCTVGSFFETPYSATHDRQAWFESKKTGAPLQYDAKLEQLWFSRKQLERAIPRHFPISPNQPTKGWPWGTHETELLRHLAAAADRWWKLYDPQDPTTAPTNEAVANWLKERGVAERNAQVMASILRAEGLPSGPRK